MRILIVVACVLTLAVAGCSSYYKVNDPTGDADYYTTKAKKVKQADAVELKDAVSGSKIILQSSEVLQIRKKEFKQATA